MGQGALGAHRGPLTLAAPVFAIARKEPYLVATLDRANALVAMGLLVTLLVVVTLGVITRFLNDPFIWTDEVSRFLMVWLACFGWMLASRRRAHIRVRYFHELLPPHWWRLAEIGMQGAVALLGALIAWFSVGLVIRNHDLEATTVPISMAWMYVPMVLAGLVTAIQGLWDVYATAASRAALPVDAAGETIE